MPIQANSITIDPIWSAMENQPTIMSDEAEIDDPLVSVIIPARNEESDIATSIMAVLEQTVDSYMLEIIIVDGNSSDETVKAAEKALSGSDFSWCIVPNPTATTPTNLNVGLHVARGKYVCRVDARSIIPVNYVAKCLETMETRPNVIGVGGRQVAIGSTKPASSGIARGLNNSLSMGGSKYRGTVSGRADTVYLGFFRTQDLLSVGGWDESLPTNQDFDLCQRLSPLGHLWFDASMEVGYIPRQTIQTVAKQYHRFGQWKAFYWRNYQAPKRRQKILLGAPLLAALAGIVSIRIIGVRATAVLAVSALAGIEHVGSTGPEAAAPARLWSAATIVATGGGWLSGVARGLLGSRRAPRGHDQKK